MAGKRAALGKPLKRRTAVRTPKKTVVVYCEGVRTEPEYLEALRREPSVREIAAVDLRVEVGKSGMVPLTLVRTAVEARKRAIAEEAEVDEFWCVFDVEWPINHPKLKEALDMARQNGIEVAVSNPCFELWLLLHFQDQGAWLDNAEACRRRAHHDSRVGKGLSAELYMQRRKVAVGRAASLDKRHVQNGAVFPQDNPSSGMYRLLSSVEA